MKKKRLPLLILLFLIVLVSGCGNDWNTLVINVEGSGQVEPEPGFHAFLHNQIVQLSPVSEQDWAFDHWGGRDGQDVILNQVFMDHDKIVTAFFTKLEYELNVTILPGTEGGTVERLIVPPERSFQSGQTVRLIANASPGFVFSHWEVGQQQISGMTHDVMMTENQNVTAVFVRLRYDLVLSAVPAEAGTISQWSLTPRSYPSNQLVEIMAYPKPGWQFDHWEGDLSGSSNPEQITMGANKRISAIFVRTDYTVTVTTLGPGKVYQEIVDTGRGYQYGQTVRLTAVPDQGNKFRGWSGALSGLANPALVTVDGKLSISASFSPNLFVAVGTNNGVAYSKDGVSWFGQPDDPSGTGACYGIAYGNGRFVTVGSSWWYGFPSASGVDWSYSNNRSADYFDVAYGSGRFVAVGNYGQRFISTDGQLWTPTQVGGAGLIGVTFGNGIFVAVGVGGRRVISSDGITWTDDQSGGSSLFDVVYGNGHFVAVGASGRRIVSTDGVLWTNDQTDDLGEFLAIAFGNGVFVAVGSARTLVSIDGLSWSHPQAFPGKILHDIAFGNGLFVVVSDYASLVSSNGTSWSQMFVPRSLYGVAFETD